MLISSEKKYILSYGGGVNSVALLFYLLEHNKPLDEVVFADTGGEIPETYQHIEIIKKILDDNNITFTKVKVKSDLLYERCEKREVIPSQIWRWCTRDLKIRPIHAHYRNLKCDIFQYLGISYEERDRKKDSNKEYIKNLFPLIDEKITRDNCIDIISKNGVKLPSRSGCFFCPFNTISRWVEIYKNHKHLYEKAMSLEENSKFYPKQKLCNLSLRKLEQMILDKNELPNIFIKRRCGSECVI